MGAARRLALTATALLLWLGATAAPALAKVEEVGGKNVGLIQRNDGGIYGAGLLNSGLLDGNLPTARTFANSSGHPVLHGTLSTYAIYWDPYDLYDGDWQSLVDTFLANLGAKGSGLETIFAVDTQYIDSTGHATDNSSFHGAYVDTEEYPSAAGCTDTRPLIEGALTCLSDAQLRTQLERFISIHALPRGMDTIYYLMTPPGVTVCLGAGGVGGHCSDFAGTLAGVEAQEKVREEKEEKSEAYVPTAEYESYGDSFCSYHAAVTPTNPETGDENTLLYGVIPWTVTGNLGENFAQPHSEEYACQDGGYNPQSDPAEERERRKELNKKEEEEVARMSKEEREKREAQEQLEGPHVQEPNQVRLDLDGDHDAGLGDLIVSQIGSLQQNIVTDPLLNAWKDSAGNESTDECRNWFEAGRITGTATAQENTEAGTLADQALNGKAYYINTAFNLARYRLLYPGTRCMGGIDLTASFTAPNPVNAGEVVGFDGMESAVSLDWAGLTLSAPGTYATYKWTFGDGIETSGYAPGSPPCEANEWLAPCAASVFHTYTYGGVYQVTLTITDVGGNTTSVTSPITVRGEPPPASTTSPPSGTSAGTSTTAGSQGGSSGSTSGAGGSPALPAPTARAAAASGSLRTALRHGLMLRYSVNEQVAGTVEVLISASLARRLHIHGAAATGLPTGYTPSVVIGRAVIVTRKGGTGQVRLRFSKATARALHRVRHVTLTLRMTLRNAEQTNPKTTSLISTFVLKGGGGSGHSGHSRKHKHRKG